jgi:lipid II:glycine glycyltransferase (peptidoglycan interpeptide bridge formation enzyme)
MNTDDQQISRSIETSLNKYYRAFRITYNRFCKLIFVEIDMGKYLSSIDLNLEKNSFSESNILSPGKEEFFDISSLIAAHEFSSRFQILEEEKENLRQLIILNDLLYKLEPNGFLNTEKLEWKLDGDFEENLGKIKNL